MQDDQKKDQPCFSREAEACRVLNTAASPDDAFQACFSEGVLGARDVAERVPMTALVGGDLVLSANKELVYEFTRVIINQHRMTEVGREHVHSLSYPCAHLRPSLCYTSHA